MFYVFFDDFTDFLMISPLVFCMPIGIFSANVFIFLVGL